MPGRSSFKGSYDFSGPKIYILLCFPVFQGNILIRRIVITMLQITYAKSHKNAANRTAEKSAELWKQQLEPIESHKKNLN